jgi:S-DNA-T family DNA segregation ATPase FtsK/SpoIIIE
VDEFQIFFAEDDKLSQDAGVLLEQLVRQGRAFGIHVILGSQTLGGAFGLARSTMGQMAVRIALQCSEADSQLILDDDNVAARLLSRPGEAIYNDAGGQIMGNSPFQTAWLPDACRDDFLSRMDKRTAQLKTARETLVVFEGSVPADIAENRELEEYLQRSQAHADIYTPQIWLGAPVAIKAPTSVTFRRQSGANVLIVGQRDEVALNLLQAALVSLAAQLSPEQARLVILDGSPQGSAHTGQLENLAGLLPQTHQIVSYRQVPEVMTELGQTLDQRIAEDLHSAAPIFVLVYGLQRYRVLRRSEDSFGLSMDAEDAGPKPPDAQFTSILREGPGAGVHCLVWADTLATVERSLDRQTLREFDFRVLFQMSATDSSNLIDSPAGNQLGFHRALLYSEEQGGIEKFRPYAAPAEDWVKQLVSLRAEE